MSSTSAPSPRAPPASSGSGSSPNNRNIDDRGRARRPGERGGRNAWSAASHAKREGYRLLAGENETVLLPALIAASPQLGVDVGSSVSYGMMPPTTEVRRLEGGRKTRFGFRNADSLDAAEELVGRWGGENVAVLNMANAFTPGGGYIHGATAQEEAICRRSTLYAHIAHPEFYPMVSEGGIWSAGVRVFRKGDDFGGAILEMGEQFAVGIVSVAAVDRPKLSPDGSSYANLEEQQLTAHKIMAILRIAKLHQQKALVLGAFGCGAFKNPPTVMAKLFRHALTENDEFKDHFSEVVFAVLERNGSENMKPWTEVWSRFVETEDGDEHQGTVKEAQGGGGGQVSGAKPDEKIVQ